MITDSLIAAAFHYVFPYLAICAHSHLTALLVELGLAIKITSVLFSREHPKVLNMINYIL